MEMGNMDMSTTPGMSMGDMNCTGHMDMGDMGMMKMYFHMDYIGETILFQGWQIHDVGSLILSMLGIFILSVLYEALKFARQWLAQYVIAYQQGRFLDEDTNIPDGRMARIGSTPFSFWHLLQTFLHILQTFISYMLMLIFMTFNGWLCIAVIVGAGVGYFAFGWRSRVVVETTDHHCH